MKYFFRAIISNIYKTIHTKILWVHILVPFVGIGLVGSYVVHSLWTENQKIMSYVQLIAVAFPLMAAIVVAMTFETDAKAGKFQNLLSVPCPKMFSHLGNLLSLLIWGLVASVITVTGFGAFLAMKGYGSVALYVYVLVGSHLLVMNIAVYLLQYMICYTWGKGISMGAGVLGTLLSILLAMGPGDKIWKFCPYSYGIRSGSYFLFRYTEPEVFIAISEENKTGNLFVAGITIVLFVFFLGWSRLWQGTTEKDE